MRAAEQRNRELLRARDRMDREFARPLAVADVARTAHLSRAEFTRAFRAAFGESPHRYLQRRRVERAKELLRTTDAPVTEICADVGFCSLGTFSRTFRVVTGESPSAYRARIDPADWARIPGCAAMAWTRPSTFGEAADARWA